MRRLAITSVKESVQGELLNGRGAYLLQHLLSRGAKISVFAGAVRDIFLAKECGYTQVKPRDWDIGVSRIPREHFDGILREVGGSRNRYGGFELSWDGRQLWELWRQEDTVGLRKTKAPPSLENILRSFVLSCNAMALDIDDGHIYEHGAIRSITLGQIAVLEDAIMHDRAVFSAKALNLTLRRPLNLTPSSHWFVRKHMRAWNLTHEFEKAYPTGGTAGRIRAGL